VPARRFTRAEVPRFSVVTGSEEKEVKRIRKIARSGLEIKSRIDKFRKRSRIGKSQQYFHVTTIS
jgi:hypothetical protein